MIRVETELHQRSEPKTPYLKTYLIVVVLQSLKAHEDGTGAEADLENRQDWHLAGMLQVVLEEVTSQYVQEVQQQHVLLL